MTDATARLLALMARLRDPAHGCPWDVEQTFATIAPYTIEEAYEVAQAIADGDMPGLKEELGDLLFQVVFHARMAEEAGHFSYDDIATALVEKMTARHPHVFGEAEARTAQAQTEAWESQKAEERAKKQLGLLADVPAALPALMRAQKLGKRAARVGFEWERIEDVFAKLEEEIAELKAAHAAGEPPARLEEELGDILFCVTNLARWLEVDAEEALRQANRKFTRRFAKVEDAAGTRPLSELTLAEMEAAWQRAKQEEKA